MSQAISLGGVTTLWTGGVNLYHHPRLKTQYQVDHVAPVEVAHVHARGRWVVELVGSNPVDDRSGQSYRPAEDGAGVVVAIRRGSMVATGARSVITIGAANWADWGDGIVAISQVVTRKRSAPIATATSDSVLAITLSQTLW